MGFVSLVTREGEFEEEWRRYEILTLRVRSSSHTHFPHKLSFASYAPCCPKDHPYSSSITGGCWTSGASGLPQAHPLTQILHANTIPGESVCTSTAEKHYYTLLNDIHLNFSKEKLSKGLTRLLIFQEKAHLAYFRCALKRQRETVQIIPLVADVASFTLQRVPSGLFTGLWAHRGPLSSSPLPTAQDGCLKWLHSSRDLLPTDLEAGMPRVGGRRPSTGSQTTYVLMQREPSKPV